MLRSLVRVQPELSTARRRKDRHRRALKRPSWRPSTASCPFFVFVLRAGRRGRRVALWMLADDTSTRACVEKAEAQVPRRLGVRVRHARPLGLGPAEALVRARAPAGRRRLLSAAPLARSPYRVQGSQVPRKADQGAACCDRYSPECFLGRDPSGSGDGVTAMSTVFVAIVLADLAHGRGQRAQARRRQVRRDRLQEGRTPPGAPARQGL